MTLPASIENFLGPALSGWLKMLCFIVLFFLMPLVGIVMLLWVMVASWIPGSTEGYHRRPYRQARVDTLAWLGRGYSLLLVLVVLIVIWPN